METLKKRTMALFAVLLVGSVISFTGCAKKTGIARAEKTTTTMQTVESDMKLASTQIDATNASLEDLVASAQSPDVKQSFDMYSDNVKRMDDVGRKLMNHINEMSAQGNSYFEEWRKQGDTYANPEIQRLSEERREHLRQTFGEVSEANVGLKGVLNSYLSDIKQIQTYLSNDLTSKGIAAITPIAERTLSDGNVLKEKFKPVLSAMDRARAEMTPGAAAGGVPPVEQ